MVSYGELFGFLSYLFIGFYFTFFGVLGCVLGCVLVYINKSVSYYHDSGCERPDVHVHSYHSHELRDTAP